MYDFISDKGDPDKEFDLIEKIGQGNYGTVYKALHKKTGKIVAAKVANIGSNNEAFKKEINVLSQCNSPYIVSYYGSYIKNYSIWIILEYCDGGSLLELINILDRGLNEEQIASLVYMILQGLNFLHENKKIHRDVKTGNILLTREGIAKLGDFGVSTQLMHSFSKKISKIGTPFYMSPEVICQNKYNYKCDIWSLGITCIEMAEGEPPFSKTKPYLVLKKIITQPPTGLKNKEKWSPEFNDFVSRCLTFDPANRPSAKDLLQHPFIQKNNKGSKLISELINNSLDDLAFYRKKILESDEEDEEEEEDNNVNNNNEVNDNEQDDGLNNSGSVIIKEGVEETGTMINLETTNKKENKNESLLNMINMYGVEGLSFQKSSSQNKDTLIAEETKMSEGHLKHSSEKKEKMSMPSNDIEDIINDPTINNLTMNEIQEEINRVEDEMRKEIEKIKQKYEAKIQKCNKSLNFLKENQFLKNLNEYKDYKKFANKIKKQIHFSNNSIQQDNQISTSIADSSIKKNNVFVYDYQHNNISLKNRLDFSK